MADAGPGGAEDIVHCATKSGSFDYNYLRGELEDVREFEVFRRERDLLQGEMGEMELVAELAEFKGHCCAEKGNKQTTNPSRLGTIICYHEHFVGLSGPLGIPLIRSVIQAVKRAHVEKSTHQRVSRPVTWGIPTRIHGSIPSWGVEERTVWIGLALFYFMMLQVLELLAGEKEGFHGICCGGGMQRLSQISNS